MNTELCTQPVSPIQRGRHKSIKVWQFPQLQLLISKEALMELLSEVLFPRARTEAPEEQTLPAWLPGDTWGWDPQHQAPSVSTARCKSNSWIASGSRWGWEYHSKTLGCKLLLKEKNKRRKVKSGMEGEHKLQRDAVRVEGDCSPNLLLTWQIPLIFHLELHWHAKLFMASFSVDHYYFPSLTYWEGSQTHNTSGAWPTPSWGTASVLQLEPALIFVFCSLDWGNDFKLALLLFHLLLHRVPC